MVPWVDTVVWATTISVGGHPSVHLGGVRMDWTYLVATLALVAAAGTVVGLPAGRRKRNRSRHP
jgi:hypothetical protein